MERFYVVDDITHEVLFYFSQVKPWIRPAWESANNSVGKHQLLLSLAVYQRSLMFEKYW